MPLQWRNQIWQSLEEGAGKRCSEFGTLTNLLTKRIQKEERQKESEKERKREKEYQAKNVRAYSENKKGQGQNAECRSPTLPFAEDRGALCPLWM